MSIEFTPPYALKDQELISNLFPSKEEVIGSKKEGQVILLDRFLDLSCMTLIQQKLL
jgi:hypothetical protein